jgi:GntR family transcriptional regulator
MTAESLPLRLSEASGVPFYRQIVDQMAEFIRSGQLPPNTRLPSVRELAGQLLVSLITIRRSYADLEAAGLIVRRQGQGTFVAREVDAASCERALAEAKTVLADAVSQARRLGLDGNQLKTFLDRLLAGEKATKGEKSGDR